MSEKIITPNFGGHAPTPPPPPPPPPGPLTYDELMFLAEQNREMIEHLKRQLVSKDEELKRAKDTIDLAQHQLKVLEDFCVAGAKILSQSGLNFKGMGATLKPR